MRTLDSLKDEAHRLRQLHTEQAADNRWQAAQSTRDKLVRVLNQIRDFKDQHCKSVDELKEHMPPNITGSQVLMAVWARGYNERRYQDRKLSDCPYTSHYATNWQQGWQRAESEMFLERVNK